jgi:hypothetical protein
MTAHIQQEKGSTETMTREEHQSLPNTTGAIPVIQLLQKQKQ